MKLWEQTKTAQTILENLKGSYPASVWKDAEKGLQELKEKMNPDRIFEKANLIRDLLSMEKQQFDRGTTQYEKFANWVETSQEFLERFMNIEKEQQKAKEDFREEYATVKNLLEATLEKVKDADVSQKTKAKTKEAAQKLKGVKVDSSSGKVDWVSIIAILTIIDGMVQQASNDATLEMNMAEKERQRKKQSASYNTNSYSSKKNNDDNNSYSSPFSSYSSDTSSSLSSDSGGFGGFDSGSSGGGGADGGW